MASKSQKPASGKQAKSAGTGTSTPKELVKLESLFELMNAHHIGELEWEKGGERIHARTVAAGVAHSHSHAVTHAPAVSHAAPAPAAVHAAPAAALAAAPASNQKQVVSPFVGTFYRSASPTSDPYVREGQSIKRGDVLCIVEAMKLMNEIEAEFAGKIVSCLVENGQPVEFGEPLFVVEV